ncbi:MAG: DUF4367 domain-containing protein [Candidatus Merdivicinus sp.]|jgi:hypothetical protein
MDSLECQLSESAPAARDQWLATFPSQDSLNNIPISPDFERKMKRLIQLQQKSKRKSWRYFAATAAALIVVFSGAMSVDAFRTSFLKILYQVNPKFTSIDVTPECTDDSEFMPFTVGYIPDGMKQVDRNYSANSLHIRYENEEGTYLLIDEKMMTEKSSLSAGVDTEDAYTENTEIQGNEAFAVSKKDWSYIMWSNRNYVFTVSGFLPLDEIKTVAESVQLDPSLNYQKNMILPFTPATCGWMPSGSTAYAWRETLTSCQTNFRSSPESFVLWQGISGTMEGLSFPYEEVAPTEITINGCPGQFWQLEEDIWLRWDQDGYTFQIDGRLPLDTLIKIAENLEITPLSSADQE